MRLAQFTVLVWLIGLAALAAMFNGNVRSVLEAVLNIGKNPAQLNSQVGQLILFWGIGAFVVLAVSAYAPRIAYLFLAVLTVSVLVGHGTAVTAYLQTLSAWLGAGKVKSSSAAASASANGPMGMAASSRRS